MVVNCGVVLVVGKLCKYLCLKKESFLTVFERVPIVWWMVG